VIGHPVQRAWYARHGHQPGRSAATDPGVTELVAQLAPGTEFVDLGGSDSLNLLLADLGVVLRVNKPFVSRRHILADQELRRYLAARGLGVAAPIVRRGVSVFRCGAYWAQLEEYVPGLTPATGTALFEAIGALHRAMSAYAQPRPRPQINTCVSPGTLRRWLDLNGASGTETAELIRMLRRQWVPANTLPTHLIHHDTHPDNVRQNGSKPFYLDLGGAASGPRIHDIAYALAYTLFDYQETADLSTFPWSEVPHFLKAYETNAGSPLTDRERTALAPYTAAVPIYYTVCDWGDRQFGRVASWLLTNPDAVTGR